jgi:hypothetical protein
MFSLKTFYCGGIRTQVFCSRDKARARRMFFPQVVACQSVDGRDVESSASHLHSGRHAPHRSVAVRSPGKKIPANQIKLGAKRMTLQSCYVSHHFYWGQFKHPPLFASRKGLVVPYGRHRWLTDRGTDVCDVNNDRRPPADV